ncbi:molecular chaperone DnaJ [Gilvimarinus agarilyticus]|uniref:molecular chaperone DnaJ n=1 Tax=Gilvimarinus sp. 2_MG-2023 TaxID=3062666 RepID=UPI001C087479|nr:molecular chaperone DnaJ [Gilvimarinus sp. 2_MG-2023]MBU2887021.1 molecular chaperone DnaJ [Gilvimarinus agarilyticus]MDO6571681.1 molecular chaperone DnaJ [Gilvimarinus sp. 2_MG-2023]
MFRLLPVLLFIALVFFGYQWLKSQPAGKKRRAILQTLFAVLMVLLIYLVMTGRIHWLGAALAALLPLGKVALGLIVQILPFLKRRTQNPQATTNGRMSPSEAAEVLGLKQSFNQGTLTQSELLKAHKALMQKVHPDRGGNDYLAQRVNQAKDVLLQEV